MAVKKASESVVLDPWAFEMDTLCPFQIATQGLKAVVFQMDTLLGCPFEKPSGLNPWNEKKQSNKNQTTHQEDVFESRRFVLPIDRGVHESGHRIAVCDDY